MNITLLCCYNSLYGAKDPSDMGRLVFKGVHKVEVPCSSRIDPVHILKAFENGADAVAVVACPDQTCQMMRGSRHLKRRVKYAQELLAETGMNPGRIFFFEPQIPSAPKLEEIIAEVKSAVEELGATA